MKRMLMLLGVVAMSVPAMGQTTMLSVSNVPLSVALDTYAELSGKRAEIVRGVAAVVTVQSDKALSATEGARLIEEELCRQNVGLFQIASNRLVATWIDPSKAPSQSLKERIAMRREALLLESQRSSSGYSGTNGEAATRKYNMELIRAQGKKGPPLPIRLTAEEDAQLVSEGILPALTATNNIGGVQHPPAN